MHCWCLIVEPTVGQAFFVVQLLAVQNYPVISGTNQLLLEHAGQITDIAPIKNASANANHAHVCWSFIVSFPARESTGLVW